VRSLAEMRRDNAQQRFEDVAEVQARRLFPSRPRLNEEPT
jgi:hypothetical protein